MSPGVLAFWDVSTVVLAVIIGLPILSIVVMALFAYTADFRFVEAKIRGGGLRGAIAAAVAKVIVRDASTIQVPLVIVIEKTGLLGGNTPLLGGATVRDLEFQVSMDDEHVTTITEARSTHIESFQQRVELPVNAEIHLPKGFIAMYRDYRRKRNAAAEVKLSVRGHVIVRHWWMNREVPVRVTRHVVLGDPVPRLAAVRWRPATPEGEVAPAVPDAEKTGWEHARLSVRLVNPYRDEVLEGKLLVELRASRRILRDRPVARYEIDAVRIRPGRRRTLRFLVRLDRPLVTATVAGGGVVDASLVRVVETPDWALDLDPGAVDDDAGPGFQVVPLVARVVWDEEVVEPEEVLVAGLDGAQTAPVSAPAAPRGERTKRRLTGRMVKLTSQEKRRT